jgi:hypothetical protein
MNDFILDYNDFISVFSEFSIFTESQLIQKLKFIKLVYCGLFTNDTNDEELRTELVYLALAHFLTLELNPLLSQGKVKTIKNRQDSVTFAVRDSNDLYDLSNTLYGKLLDQKLDVMCKGGFLTQSQDIGNLSQLDFHYDDY